MSDPNRRPTDLRKDRQRMERQLVVAAVVLFLIAGGILVGFIYGWPAIITALLCLLPGLLGLVLLWLLLRLLEHFTDRWE
jgi:protein-S-isoprenylcysteine O-methyltransferase Ste14